MAGLGALGLYALKTHMDQKTEEMKREIVESILYARMLKYLKNHGGSFMNLQCE